jgi:hypothetical protein
MLSLKHIRRLQCLQGHLTNHAQNTSGDVWPLQQLLALLGDSAAATLQQQLAATAGRVLAVAAGPVQQAAQELKLPQGTCAFEVLGTCAAFSSCGLGFGGPKDSRQGIGSSSRAGAASSTGAEFATRYMCF